MNSIGLVVAASVVLGLLIISEIGWRRHWLHGEVGRKFVHVSVGTFVAFWPYFLDWTEIRLLSLAFFFVVLAAMHLGVFQAIRSVQRPTYGEIFFALSVGLLTLVTESKGIYAAAILQMALADGFAAIVGGRYGRENKYRMFGRTKSLVGSGTFLVISLGILIGYSQFSDNGLAWELIFLTALGATLFENIASLGFDNLVVPLAVGILLQAAATV